MHFILVTKRSRQDPFSCQKSPNLQRRHSEPLLDRGRWTSHPPPHTTHHNHTPYTIHHIPLPHPTPPYTASFFIWIDDLRLSGAHRWQPEGVTNQTTNTSERYLQYLKRILWKKKIENTAKTEPHQRPPGIFQRIIFCYLWCWCYHSFVLGNQCQLELVACSQLTQKLPANWIILLHWIYPKCNRT